LTMIRPSNTNSIIGVFIDPPKFSNTKGTMSLSGVIPNGIRTSSGLLTTMTFKANTAGVAKISISDMSRVLANDGLGTEVKTQFDRGSYTILPVEPAGPRVFSETHPFQSLWYNNNSPQISWDQDPGVTNFSYVLDDKPFTVPGNFMDSTSTITSYQNLHDGIYYFHIKAKKQGIWGPATHFMIRIDTSPPASFRPEVSFMTTASSTRHGIVTFFTTDFLSGLDHYEIGITEDDQSADGISVFEQVTSPYHFPINSSHGKRVTVRAFDRAGNTIDETINVVPPSGVTKFIVDNILLIILLLILIADLLFGHRTILHIKRIFKAVKEEEKREFYEHEKAVEAKEYLEKFSNEK